MKDKFDCHLERRIIIGKREENKIKHYQETHKTIGGIEYKRCTNAEFKPRQRNIFISGVMEL